MRRSVKKYAQLFTANWSSTIQYRGDFIAWGIAQSIGPLVALAIWYTITTSSETALTPQEAVTYFLAVIFLNNIVYGPDGFMLGQDILQGKIVQHLMKPYQTLLSYLTSALTTRSIFVTIFAPALVVLIIASPNLFANLVLTPTNLLLFALSAILGAGIFFALDSFLATSAFWLEESHEIRRFRHVLESISAGILIPYAVMPEAMQTWLSFLPFRYMLSTPAEIISGQTVNLSPLRLIIIQIIWLVILATLFRISYRRGLRVYATPTQ